MDSIKKKDIRQDLQDQQDFFFALRRYTLRPFYLNNPVNPVQKSSLKSNPFNTQCP